MVKNATVQTKNGAKIVVDCGSSDTGYGYGRLTITPATGSPIKIVFPLDSVAADHRFTAKIIAGRARSTSPQDVLNVRAALDRITEESFTVATRAGWNGASIVARGMTYSYHQDATPELLEELKSDFVIRGSLRDWLRTIEQIPEDAYPLIFAVAASFVGPLLPLVNVSTIGFMFVGPSSGGKTKGIGIAATSWATRLSNPSAAGCETWSKTYESFDKVVARHRHGLLVVDETQASARTLREQAEAILATLMRLSTDQTKERFTDDAPPLDASLVYFATSNYSLSKYCEILRREPDDALFARLIEIPLRSSCGMLAPSLSRSDRARLIDRLNEDAIRNAGTSIDAFLKRLTREIARDRERFVRRMKRYCLEFETQAGTGDFGGIDRRIADRFAIVYAAGRLAIHWGLLPFGRDVLGRAVHRCLAANAAYRASVLTSPTEQFVERILEGIPSAPSNDADEYVQTDLYVTQTIGGAAKEYLVPTWAISKFIGSSDPNLVLRSLRTHGILHCEQDKRTQKRKLWKRGNATRVYCLRASALHAFRDRNGLTE